EVLVGATEQAQARLQAALGRTQDSMARAEILRRSLMSQLAVGKFNEGVATGLEALKVLGFDVHAKPSAVDMLSAIGHIAIKTRRIDVEKLAQAPMMTDARVRKVIEIINAFLFGAQVTNETLWAYLNFRQILLLLEHGHTRFSAFAFNTFAAMNTKQNNYASAMKLSEVSERLFARDADMAARGEAGIQRLAFVEHGGLAPQAFLSAVAETFVASTEAGNPFFPGLSALVHCFGASLISVEKGMEAIELYGNYFTTRPDPMQLKPYLAIRQTLLALRGQTVAATSLTDATYDEATETATLRALGPMAFLLYGCTKIRLHWTHRDFQGSLTVGDETLGFGLLQRFPDSYCAPFVLYYLTTITALAAERGVGSKKALISAGAKQCLAKARTLAQASAARYGGFAALIDAELAALDGDHAKAARGYEAATTMLADSGYTAFAVVGYDCAYRYYRRAGQRVNAAAFGRLTLDALDAWGASTRIAPLTQEMEGLPFLGALQARPGTSTTKGTTRTSTRRMADSLDVPALVEASQALAQEVTVEGAVRRLVEVMKDATGATHGALAVEEQGELRLHGVDGATRTEGLAPVKLVQYVMRTSKTVRLDDVATQGADFKDDPYLRARPAKSLLCVPIVHQGKVRGAAYLENGETTHAFAAGRVTLVEVLAAQGTIYLENTALYADMERRLQERTAALEKAHRALIAAEKASVELQMAGGFAHEMRNALHSVTMGLDSLYQESAGKISTLPAKHATTLAALQARLEPDARKVVAEATDDLGYMDELVVQMRRGAERASRVTQQILEFAQTGEVAAASEAVALAKVMDSILGELSGKLQASAVQVRNQGAEAAVVAAR
ncbi:MAG TPA: GAF domain-containing protein, partial [Myxococcota bacterium]|nr:GAF domain-containing protein [Myxococcota bacterium]